MMSPMASGSTLFNRLKANKGLTKGLPEEPLVFANKRLMIHVKIDVGFFWQTWLISPKGGSLYQVVVWGRVSWLLRLRFLFEVESSIVARGHFGRFRLQRKLSRNLQSHCFFSSRVFLSQQEKRILSKNLSIMFSINRRVPEVLQTFPSWIGALN